MYDFYFHGSPNTFKIGIFFEEAGVEYRTIVIDVSKGEQFSPEFKAISPNSKVPVLVDNAPQGGGDPLTVFESNAILLYLAEKEGKLIPTDPAGRSEMLSWLFWQAANQGPMFGQCAHFTTFAPDSPYAVERYTREVRRLVTVLDDRLAEEKFVGGNEFSILDIACYPWFDPHTRVAIKLASLDEFPNVDRWVKEIEARPAVGRAYARLMSEGKHEINLEQFAQNMFGHSPEMAKQTAQRVGEIMQRMKDAGQDLHGRN